MHREPDDTAASQIATIREFNRFYVARLGLLQKRHLGGDHSLPEARILYEIGIHPRIIASDLRNILGLDAGYISRLLALLARQKLIRSITSRRDAREKELVLTAKGVKAVARLNLQSDRKIHEMLINISPEDRRMVADSLATVSRLLKQADCSFVHIERITVADWRALSILEEYYEAVHVIQRDTPAKIQKLLNQRRSGLWLAFLGEEVVGCVILKELPSIPSASECKRLYVKPSARGRHIADRLLDVLEDYAQEQGVKHIYLDTYDDLKTAISLYKRRGYQLCERYNENPQATIFMRRELSNLRM